MKSLLLSLSSVLSLLLALLPGCMAEDPGPECPIKCACNQDSCPKDFCGLKIELSSDCEGVEDAVEVALRQCLENTLLVPGESYLSCGAIPLYQSMKVYLRGQDKIWSEEFTCTPAKAKGFFLFQASCQKIELR